MPAAAVVVIVGFLAGAALTRLLVRRRVESWARSWLEHWRREESGRIGRRASERSGAVLRGRMAEQLAPLQPDFVYDPADARFIGTPVDFVIFDGWTEVRGGRRDSLRSIVLVDVKTGGSSLTTVQRRIRDCVERGAVTFVAWSPEASHA